MRQWLTTGPVHRFVVEKSSNPNFVPIADPILLRKGMLMAASLEGAAMGFSSMHCRESLICVNSMYTSSRHVCQPPGPRR